jgi:hypothetical protein
MITLDVRRTDQVTSWKEMDVELVDPTRRMHIISGIACPEFYVNDDDSSYAEECVVSLNMQAPDFIQATCQVGLASVSNDDTAFRFALNDSWVEADQNSGELKLHVNIEAKGEKTSLSRFGFQVVVLYGNRIPGVYGRIYWSRDLLDPFPQATALKGTHHPPVVVPSLVQVHAKMTDTNTPVGTFHELDLGFVTPIGSLQAQDSDYWVEYTFEHLPLGVPVRVVGENFSPRFGIVDMIVIYGPDPVTLTPSHLSERVDFRIVRHEEPR